MPSTVDLVIPVYNEEDALRPCIEALVSFLASNLANPWKITIADNASTDCTRAVGESLSQEYTTVQYLHLAQKGRGRALRTAWLASDADILSYMDVDLSTDIRSYPALIQAIESGCHIAIGSRLSRDSQITRPLKREVISRGYNALIKVLFFSSFPDAQCGFKALTQQTAISVLPYVENNNWFFDTELLLIAAKLGYRIESIPVHWDDDPTSTVNILGTAIEDIKGLLRLRLGGIPATPIPLSNAVDSHCANGNGLQTRGAPKP